MVLDDDSFEFVRSRHPGKRLPPLVIRRHVEQAHKRWSKRKRRGSAVAKIAAMLQQAIDKGDAKP